MKKLVATVALTFTLGAGLMAALGGMLGAAAEAASVGVVGAGLVAGSYALGGRLGKRPSRPQARPRQVRPQGAA